MFSEEEYEIMEDVIAGMVFKPFSHGDRYYPSEEEINTLGTETADGKREYTKQEIAYMLWLVQFPSRDDYPGETAWVRDRIMEILGEIKLFKEAS